MKGRQGVAIKPPSSSHEHARRARIMALPSLLLTIRHM
ncbi:Hypothetical protein A7982_04727 [Minicystis rosea]|nr:Hypothetical protein A7982_04727 [Minicystis rosea]